MTDCLLNCVTQCKMFKLKLIYSVSVGLKSLVCLLVES